MADPQIPQPVTSGATDQPNAPQPVQSGQNGPPVPPGFGDAQGPPVPAGFQDLQNQDNQNTPKAPEDSDESSIINPIGQVGMGVVKGLGQTVSTAGHLINLLLKQLPSVGGIGGLHQEGNPITDKIDRGLKILDTATTPKGFQEKTGVLLEGIGEFFVGDEALKGLSMADRIGLTQKVLDLGQKYPFLAKVIGHGLQSLRQGVVAGGQTLAHGGTPGEALTTGAEATVLGTGAGVATDLVGAGASKVAQGVKKVVTAAARTPEELQPEFQQGIRDLVDQVAAENKVSGGKSPSIREHVGEVAQNVEDKAVKMLQEVDQAAGEPFVQKFRQRLSNIRREINSLPEAGGGPREAELELEKQGVESDMEEALQRAEAQGVPRKQLDEGLQLFKKAQALFDLDTEIKRPSVTTGLPPNMGTAAQAAKDPELVKPSNFFNRIYQMYGKGRLQEALGEDRAKNLITHISDAKVNEHELLMEKVAAQKKIDTAKKVGLVAGSAAVGTGLVGAAKTAWDLTH